MKRGPIIHGVLLLAMLLFAYQTWTREDKVERKTGDIQIWSLAERDITAVVYDTKNKTVRVEKRTEGSETYLWGTQTLITRTKKVPPRPEGPEGHEGHEGHEGAAEQEPIEEIQTTVREFAVGPKGAEMVQHLTELRAMRELGDPSDEDLKEFGLDSSEDNVTVTHKGGTMSLVVGGKVYGGQDRYARDPQTGKVYVVAGEVLNDLLTGESALRVRELHAFEDDAVAKAVVIAAGQTRNLVRIMVDDEAGKKTKNWALASAPDKPDQTMANFLKNLGSLQPTRFEPELDPKDLNLMVKVEYQRANGNSLGWLELYEKVEAGAEPAEAAKEGEVASEGEAAQEGEAARPTEKPVTKTYYLRTELTRTYALVPLGAATRVTEDIGQIFTE